ncbi:hypothetical protein ABMY26_13690 [Azospirillum sp. HJ39]|uniref:hypothetical protein n=1 Tax=Azospirillum sp. HJ39 TaxID=3159496 RepID=UPI0035566962
MSPVKTDAISIDSVISLVNAFAYAEYTGTPFTVYLAISWSKTQDWTDDQISNKQEAFARKLRKWLSARNIPLAYLYTSEIGNKLGINTHVAVHIPFEHFFEFQNVLNSLVPGFNGNHATAKVQDDKWRKQPKYHYHPNQRLGSFKYLLKGIDPDASFNANGTRIKWCEAIGIIPKSQGVIVGRRAGVSHTLGKIARGNAGWIDRTSPAAIAAALTLLPKGKRGAE